MAMHYKNVKMADLNVGDRLAEKPMWGEVVRIRPYVCGVSDFPLDTTGWRVAAFQNGVEVTMTVGGTWFPG